MSTNTSHRQARRARPTTFWVCWALLGLLALGWPAAAQTNQIPLIITQPKTQGVLYGQRATLSVEATGTPPLSYQWYVGFSGDTSAPLLNATNNTYTTEQLFNTYRYWVRVSNQFGSVDSGTARIDVEPELPGIYYERLPIVICGQGCYPNK